MSPLFENLKIKLVSTVYFERKKIESLVALINEAHDRHRWLFPENRTSVLEFTADLEMSDLILFVEDLNGKVLGTCLICIEENGVYFSNAAIQSSFQGQGLGTQMIKAIESLAISRSLRRLRIKAVNEIGNVKYFQETGFYVVSIEHHSAGTWGALKPFCLSTMEKIVV